MSRAYPPPKLVTAGIIAAELGVPVDRVCRVLRTRPHIKPRAYAGHSRLFNNEAIALIRHELNAIDARQRNQKEVRRV